MRKENNPLPESWEMVTLGDFVENEKGKKPRNQSDRSDATYQYPYIDIEAFEQGIIKSYADGENCRLCYSDDFLMVWDGSRSGLVGKGMDGALGSTLVRINFPQINNDYAYYFLKSKYLEINTRAKGSGTPHVDPDLLWNYKFPIPPKNEQKRIVEKIEELFTELDRGVESLKKAQEQLKVYRQALLKQAFEGKLTEQWRKDNPDKLESAKQLLERIKQERETCYRKQLDEWNAAVEKWQAHGKTSSKPKKPSKHKDTEVISAEEYVKLPGLASNWSYIRFGELIDNIEAGKSFRCEEREPQASEIGVAKVSAVSWGEYDQSESKTCTNPEKVVSDYFIRKRDFLMSRANTIDLVGAVVIVREASKSIMLSDKTLRISLDDSLKAFALHYLRSGLGRKEIMSRSTGNQDSMRNIGQDRIRSICIPICGELEIMAVIHLLEKDLSIVDEQMQTIDTSLAKSAALRQSILKQAFAGQLVSQSSKDEPAKALLERIANKRADSKNKATITKKIMKRRKTAV